MIKLELTAEQVCKLQEILSFVTELSFISDAKKANSEELFQAVSKQIKRTPWNTK